MTVDPRIPIMLGRSTSGVYQPGRHCLHQARSAVRCSASRMKGELHPSKNRSSDGLRHLMPTCSWMTAPMSYFVFFGAATPETAMGILLCNCLVGALPYSHYVMRSLPLCGRGGGMAFVCVGGIFGETAGERGGGGNGGGCEQNISKVVFCRVRTNHTRGIYPGYYPAKSFCEFCRTFIPAPGTSGSSV